MTVEYSELDWAEMFDEEYCGIPCYVSQAPEDENFRL